MAFSQVRCSRISRLYIAEDLSALPPPFTLLSWPYMTLRFLGCFRPSRQKAAYGGNAAEARKSEAEAADRRASQQQAQPKPRSGAFAALAQTEGWESMVSMVAGEPGGAEVHERARTFLAPSWHLR